MKIEGEFHSLSSLLSSTSVSNPHNSDLGRTAVLEKFFGLRTMVTISSGPLSHLDSGRGVRSPGGRRTILYCSMLVISGSGHIRMGSSSFDNLSWKVLDESETQGTYQRIVIVGTEHPTQQEHNSLKKYFI